MMAGKETMTTPTTQARPSLVRSKSWLDAIPENEVRFSYGVLVDAEARRSRSLQPDVGKPKGDA